MITRTKYFGDKGYEQPIWELFRGDVTDRAVAPDDLLTKSVCAYGIKAHMDYAAFQDWLSYCQRIISPQFKSQVQWDRFNLMGDGHLTKPDLVSWHKQTPCKSGSRLFKLDQSRLQWVDYYSTIPPLPDEPCDVILPASDYLGDVTHYQGEDKYRISYLDTIVKANAAGLHHWQKYVMTWHDKNIGRRGVQRPQLREWVKIAPAGSIEILCK